MSDLLHCPPNVRKANARVQGIERSEGKERGKRREERGVKGRREERGRASFLDFYGRAQVHLAVGEDKSLANLWPILENHVLYQHFEQSL